MELPLAAMPQPLVLPDLHPAADWLLPLCEPWDEPLSMRLMPDAPALCSMPSCGDDAG